MFILGPLTVQSINYRISSLENFSQIILVQIHFKLNYWFGVRLIMHASFESNRGVGTFHNLKFALYFMFFTMHIINTIPYF